MKSDRVHRPKRKERLKGLRASDFLKGRRVETEEGPENWGFQDTWPLADLFKGHPGSRRKSFDAPQDAVMNHRDILGWCVEVLSSSVTARLMLKEAASEGWSLGIADLGGHDFHLDVPEKQIILDDNGLLCSALGRSGYFLNVIRISLIRALRDVWQEKRHGGFDTHYGPDDILMLERVRAADCDVIAVLISWELRGEGHQDLWRHLVGSEEGDLAMAFSNRLEKDPSSLYTGAALSAAFSQWYRDIHRVNGCDHETLEYLDDVIRGNGRAGDSAASAFGQRKLTRIGIEVLSCLPDKTAYLRGQGQSIMTDPLYAGMHDEINQSHYMQVMYDMQVTYIHGIPFRDSSLAGRIFPGGEFTRESEPTNHNS